VGTLFSSLVVGEYIYIYIYILSNTLKGVGKTL
jgi:hypothetical protein